MQAERKYVPFKSYMQSKLANVISATEMHHRCKMAVDDAGAGAKSPVCVTSVHPGLVDTPLARHYLENDAPPRWLVPLLRPVMRAISGPVLIAPELSALTVTNAALADEASVAGKYMVGTKAARPARAAEDPDQRARLWETSCRLAGIDDPLPCLP